MIGCSGWNGLLAKNGDESKLGRLGTRVCLLGHESCYIYAVFAVGTLGTSLEDLRAVNGRVSRLMLYSMSSLRDVRGGMGLN